MHVNNIAATYYINLDKRLDRRQHIEAQFAKIGFSNYVRFPAIETEHGGVGCALSHVKILEEIQRNGSEVAMTFEDDAEFLEPREVIDSYAERFTASR